MAGGPGDKFSPPQSGVCKTGLPGDLKAGLEALSGMNLDHVTVHYNSAGAALNAHAYAQGTQIHLGPGQAHHLPHEAWHVVQQAQGRVQPNMSGGPQHGYVRAGNIVQA